MNLVVDESVDRRIVDALRRDGHNVLYVSEFVPIMLINHQGRGFVPQSCLSDN